MYISAPNYAQPVKTTKRRSKIILKRTVDNNISRRKQAGLKVHFADFLSSNTPPHPPNNAINTHDSSLRESQLDKKDASYPLRQIPVPYGAPNLHLDSASDSHKPAPFKRQRFHYGISQPVLRDLEGLKFDSGNSHANESVITHEPSSSKSPIELGNSSLEVPLVDVSSGSPITTNTLEKDLIQFDTTDCFVFPNFSKSSSCAVILSM